MHDGPTEFNPYFTEDDAREHYERMQRRHREATRRAEELASRGYGWMNAYGLPPEDWRMGLASFRADMADCWGDEAVARLCPRAGRTRSTA